MIGLNLLMFHFNCPVMIDRKTTVEYINFPGREKMTALWDAQEHEKLKE